MAEILAKIAFDPVSGGLCSRLGWFEAFVVSFGGFNDAGLFHKVLEGGDVIAGYAVPDLGP